MKKITVLLLFIPFLSFTQNSEPKIDDPPLSGAAFKTAILDDLNFILFGEDKPKEGLTYSLSSDKSLLELSGKLPFTVGSSTVLTNLSASFESDGGLVVLDDKDGAKKININLNFYRGISWFNYRTYTFDEKTNNKQQLYIQKMELFNEGVYEAQKDSLQAHIQIANLFKIPIDKSDIYKNTLNFTDTNFEAYSSYLKEYLKNDLLKELINENYDVLRTIAQKLPGFKVNRNMNDTEKEFYKNFKSAKFFKNYRDLKNKLSKKVLAADKIKQEREQAKDIWTGKNLLFLGLGINYSREFLNIYTPVTGVTDFSKLFEEERGNLYGLSVSANWYKQSRNLVLFGKLTAGLNRVSNFDNFNKKEFITTESFDGFSNSTTQTKKTGYVSKDQSSYKFTGSKTLSGEAYLSYKHFGLFAQLGIRDDNFAGVKDKIPFQYGVFLGLKAKDKDKELVNLLVFIDRENIKNHPNGDTNIGFRVGLPFNIR